MKKKLIPIMLSVIFILSSFMTITVFAASFANQDGLTATLTSSKTTYAANEDIDLSLTVTNNNAYAVDGIQTLITLPDGITLKSGSLAQNVFSLAAGESKTNSAAFIKNVTVTPTENLDDTKSPQTGDSSNMVIWLTLMFVSAGALVFLGVKNKKTKSNGILSLFLCFAILGAVGLPITANAASTQKSFTVFTDLKVDGKAVTVSAVITYGYTAHNTVTVTNGNGSATYAEGDTVTITANTAPEGQHFTGWTVVSGGVALADASKVTTTFTMPDKAVEIKANYEVNTYTITARSDSNGAVSPVGIITVNHGEDKAFTITPNDGYHVVDVLVDGASVGAVTGYTFANVVANGHTIEGTFAKNTYTVTVNNGTMQGGAATVAWGETVTIVANTPTADKEFKDWSVVSGGITLTDSTQATTTFTMPKEDVELTANYQPPAAKLAANAEAGKITGAPRDDNPYGSTYPTIFTLRFSSPLSSGATINIKDVYRGSHKVFDDTAYSFDSSTNIVSFYIERSQILGITDTNIIFTVTLNGVESDERTINVG